MSAKRSFSKHAVFAVPATILALAGCGDSGTTGTGVGGTTTSSNSSTTTNVTTTTGTTTGTATTTTGSSTSTGMNILPTAMCPGGLLDLMQDQTMNLHGTTTGSTDSFKEFCADKDATTASPDVVYELKVEQTCSFHLTFTETTNWDGAVEIRSKCAMENSGVDPCINNNNHGEAYKAELAAGTYYLIVDGGGKLGASGDYDLTVSCATPKCGDGIVNTAEEQCDPSAGPPYDGVSWSGCGLPGTPNACKFAPASAADTCALIPASGGIKIDLTATDANPLFIPATDPLFDTRVATANYESTTCIPPNAAPGMGGLDQVFEFLPQASGTLSVTIGQDRMKMDDCQPPGYDQPTCWIHTMWFRGTTCELGVELPAAGSVTGSGCTESSLATNYVDTITATVVAGQPYWLFVQGNGTDIIDVNQNGEYLLRATLK